MCIRDRLKPDYGNIFIDKKKVTGVPIYKRALEYKVSVVPQSGGVFSDLSCFNNLKAIADLVIYSKKEKNFKIEKMISKFELDAVRKVEAKHLSGGYKRRLTISMSLLGEPEILLMDEPLAALDPQTIQMLQNIIIKLQSEYNLTILITCLLYTSDAADE